MIKNNWKYLICIGLLLQAPVLALCSINATSYCSGNESDNIDFSGINLNSDKIFINPYLNDKYDAENKIYLKIIKPVSTKKSSVQTCKFAFCKL